MVHQRKRSRSKPLLLRPPSKEQAADRFPLYWSDLAGESMLLLRRFRGHPTPAFVAPWRLPQTQPSQVLANFEPTAAVLITKLRLVFRNALREIWRAILR
jgi:hypothetical protein